jgi:hypothetical protein
MRISRGELLRAMLASAVMLPTAAYAETTENGAFRSDNPIEGVHPWTSIPDVGGRPLGFTIIGDNTAYARPGVFDQAMVDMLARNPNPQWTFVVMHKPGWKSQDKQFAKIQAMLAGRPYTVIAGHTHYFTHEVIDGHDYINMATCGGIRQRPGPGSIDHIINVTLTQKGPLYANMRLTGLMNVAGESGQTLAY